MLEFDIVFDGFWRESNKVWITPCAGIYCVYACTFLSDVQKVHLDELLYIGQSENINERIVSHEKAVSWKSCLSPVQELCYSVAEVPHSRTRDICEAALIYVAHPRCNEVLAASYSQEAVKVSLSGKIGLLPSVVQVSQS